MKIFRYIGNKDKIIDYLSSPPKGIKRIVEVFAGSMCYAIKYCNSYKVLGIEINNEYFNTCKTRISEINPITRQPKVFKVSLFEDD